MSQSNDFPHDPFEEHVADLLSRTARVARPNPALGQLVRQRLTSDYGSLSRPRPAARFWPMAMQFGSFAMATLIVGAVVAVLLTQGGASSRRTTNGGSTTAAWVTAVAQASPTQPPSCGDDSSGGTTHYPYTLPPDHSVAINKSATSNGITITLDRAYADATQTVIVFHTTGGDPQAFYNSNQLVLTDASGKQYGGNMSSSVNSPGHTNEQNVLFSPMPQNELGVPHRLTFSVAKLLNSNVTVAQNGEASTPVAISGPWRIPFTLTPVAGTTIPVTLPAQTHDGITIQVESVGIAPAGGGLDGQNGGARIHVRVSGLPANMLLLDVASYSTAFQEGPDGAGSSSSPGQLPGDMGCPQLDLSYFPGLPILPGFIEVNGEYPSALSTNTDPTTWPKVGPSGTAEMDVLFYGPFKAGSGSMTLTFDGIRMSTPESGIVNGMPKDLRVAHGPWVFDIPLK